MRINFTIFLATLVLNISIPFTSDLWAFDPTLSGKFDQHIKSSSYTQEAILKENAVIYDMTDNRNKIRLKNERNVLIVSNPNIYRVVYILDKNLNIKYETLRKNVILIDQDLNLEPRPKNFKTYPPAQLAKITDRDILLQSTLKYHQEIIDTSYNENIIVPDTFHAVSQIFELRGFYKWYLPVDIGAGLSYQTGKFKSQYGVSKWSAIYGGPTIRFPVYTAIGYSLKLAFSYMTSFYYNHTLSIASSDNIRSEEVTVYQESNSFSQVDIENIWRTFRLGSIILGVSFRYYLTSLNDHFSSFEQNSSNYSRGTYAASLNFGWELDFDFYNQPEHQCRL